MPNPPAAQFPLPAVSLTDILTTFKLLVQAVNNWSTTELDINGNQSLSGITSATLVKASPGRVVTLSVIVAGAAGTIYDANSTTDTSRPICVIPATAGVTQVNMTCQFGIVVAPGSGQTASVGYS